MKKNELKNGMVVRYIGESGCGLTHNQMYELDSTWYVDSYDGDVCVDIIDDNKIIHIISEDFFNSYFIKE